jgi:hypothetical protein
MPSGRPVLRQAKGRFRTPQVDHDIVFIDGSIRDSFCWWIVISPDIVSSSRPLFTPSVTPLSEFIGNKLANIAFAMPQA